VCVSAVSGLCAYLLRCKMKVSSHSFLHIKCVCVYVCVCVCVCVCLMLHNALGNINFPEHLR
jgi:hypothetical protein